MAKEEHFVGERDTFGKSIVQNIKNILLGRHLPARRYPDGTQQLKAEEPILTEEEILAQYGFTYEQILALFWLRQWYQNGGSDRVEVIRHLEFLKRLVLNGQIEL